MEIKCNREAAKEFQFVWSFFAFVFAAFAPSWFVLHSIEHGKWNGGKESGGLY
jgi:hypothetical protein